MPMAELIILTTLLFVLLMLWPMGFLHGYIRGRQGKVYAVLKDLGVVPDAPRAEKDAEQH
jgi:hypothetical protein